MKDDGNLVWIDLEMTGLNPFTDRILEVATIVTDSRRSSASNVPEPEMTRLATSSAMLRPTISSLRRPLMVS